MALTHQLAHLLSSTGGEAVGLNAFRGLSPSVRASMTPKLGPAFGHTFLFPFAMIMLAILAAFFLPRKKVEPTSEGAATAVD